MARKRKKARRYASRRRKKQAPFTSIVLGAVVVVGGAMLLVQVFSPRWNTFFIPREDQLTTNEFGLQYMDMVVGDGPEAQPGQNVSVHYTGWLTDGILYPLRYKSLPAAYQISGQNPGAAWHGEGCRYAPA